MQDSSGKILRQVVVRPIYREERARWQALMREHHYLGFGGLIGERIEYVATVNERWVALLAWAAAALKLGVIAQKEVSDKTNEIPELKNLLNPLPIKGALVTADAMHTQVDSATFIVREKEADFMFTVKDNQPTLKAQLENSLGDQVFSPSVS